MVDFAVWSYTEILKMALPIGIVYAIADRLITMFLRAAFGGKLWL